MKPNHLVELPYLTKSTHHAQDGLLKNKNKPMDSVFDFNLKHECLTAAFPLSLNPQGFFTYRSMSRKTEPLRLEATL